MDSDNFLSFVVALRLIKELPHNGANEPSKANVLPWYWISMSMQKL